jgi:hypothetical protein
LKSDEPLQQENPIDKSELDRLQGEHLELMRLRAQVAAFRQAQNDLTNVQTQLAQMESKLHAAKIRQQTPELAPLATGLKPLSEFENLGRLRPANAFETLLWAQANLATNIVAQSITFDEESRAKAETTLAGISGPLKDQLTSIEQMVAFGMMNATQVVGMRVAGEEPISDDEFRLIGEWQYKDGRIQPNSWKFRRDASGEWKMLIEPGMMDKLGRMLGEATVIAKNPRLPVNQDRDQQDSYDP